MKIINNGYILDGFIEQWWDFIRLNYYIKKDDLIEVKRYIEHNIDIVNIIRMVPREIMNYFGYDAKLKLNILPDADDIGCINLSLTIITNKLSDDAYRALVRFRHNWWYELDDEATKLISLGFIGK